MLLEYWNNFHKRSSVVLKECREDIIQSNLSMPQKMCVVALMLLFGYSVVTALMFKNQRLYLIYQVFLLIHAVFVLFVFWYGKQKQPSLAVVQSSCIAFIVSMMMFVSLISLTPYQDRPGLFFPILYVTMFFIFMLPFWMINLVMTAVCAAYITAVICLKSPSAQTYDLFGAVTVWVLGICLSFWGIDLRLREYESKLKLRNASLIDDMTGLPNRRCFNSYIEYKYAECVRKSQAFSVFLFDIDDFKSYNDTYGHLAGDQCLGQLGKVLRTYAHDQELFIARYGGEEFIGVLAGDAAANAQKHAQQLQDQIRQCPMPAEPGQTVCVTVSVGFDLVQQAQNLTSYMELVKNADVALYRAKANGKDRVERYALAKMIQTVDGEAKM